MATEQVVDQLNSFLRGEISAVETYRQALEKVDLPTAKQELVACHKSHQERVDRLTKRIMELGGAPAAGSGPWGTFAKMVEGGATLIGARAAIAALEEGEDHGLADYKADLSKLDQASRALIEREVLPAQERTHRTLSSLKAALH